MKIYLIFLLLALFSFADAKELDYKLSLIKQVYQLEAKNCSKPIEHEPLHQEKVEAGQLLFESESLSGDRDIACKNCHLDEFHSADGLPLAIGVGGTGEGSKRLKDGKGVLVQRNAFSLFGRGHSDFSTFFWDGKAQLEHHGIVSQFGEYLPDTFTSTLSVAAILPLIERDEFIGTYKWTGSNEIQRNVENKLYYERFKAVSNAIRNRLLNNSIPSELEIAKKLNVVGINIENMTLVDIGNLLAMFIQHKFSCKPSRWDDYIAGDLSALTTDQKEGAVLFYGKGRCASCHSGKFHSDFDFHSIGTPQGAFGPHSRHRDIGRAAVTHEQKDLYLFRTPPLNGVSKTAPYGHNGIFSTLHSVITHHFNPLSFYLNHPELEKVDHFIIGKLTQSRDKILATIDLDKDEEVELIIQFLDVL